MTVTVKVQALVLPLVSLAVQVTVFTPRLKVEPLAGLHATVAPGQLSVAVGSVQVTLPLEHWPLSVLAVMFAGQAPMTGFSVSLIVTVKLQVLILPLASVAVHITVFTPLLNVEPLAGLHDGALTPGQLSVATGAAQVTLAFEHCPASVLPTMLAGQVMLGFSVSLMVTLKEQEALLPEVSVAVQLTVVLPFGKVEPLAGVQEVATPGQLSAEVTVHTTLALEHCPGSVLATMLAGQTMLGF